MAKLGNEYKGIAAGLLLRGSSVRTSHLLRDICNSNLIWGINVSLHK